MKNQKSVLVRRSMGRGYGQLQFHFSFATTTKSSSISRAILSRETYKRGQNWVQVSTVQYPVQVPVQIPSGSQFQEMHSCCEKKILHTTFLSWLPTTSHKSTRTKLNPTGKWSIKVACRKKQTPLFSLTDCMRC